MATDYCTHICKLSIREVQQMRKDVVQLRREVRRLRATLDNAIVWSVEDFIDRARERGYVITHSQAAKALNDMIRHHDCNHGINWDTLDYYIGEYGRPRKVKVRGISSDYPEYSSKNESPDPPVMKREPLKLSDCCGYPINQDRCVKCGCTHL